MISKKYLGLFAILCTIGNPWVNNVDAEAYSEISCLPFDEDLTVIDWECPTPYNEPTWEEICMSIFVDSIMANSLCEG